MILRLKTRVINEHLGCVFFKKNPEILIPVDSKDLNDECAVREGEHVCERERIC